MQIWPHSATLSETGAAGAAAAPPAGGGGGLSGGGAGAAGAMAAPNAGEILLNRAESAALAALETEEDEATGLRRAQAESGLTRQQLDKLRRRVQTASSKGYTLKGANFVKKPLASAPDEPGLTRKAVKGDDADEAPAKTAKATVKAKETNASALFTRTVADDDLYSTTVEDYGRPAPQSGCQAEADPNAKESNSMSTLASMLRKNQRRRRA